MAEFETNIVRRGGVCPALFAAVVIFPFSTASALAEDDRLAELVRQINRAVNVIDDGKSTKGYQVDNENASSRFRFLGSTSPLNDTVTMTLFEFEWPVNGSLRVNQLNQSPSPNDGFNMRLLEVAFANDSWGSVFLGQGWMASDGTAEMDISGVTTPFWSGQTFGYGGMLPTVDGGLYDHVPHGAPPNAADYATPETYQTAVREFSANGANFVNILNLGHNFDDLRRLVRVRYNTPVYNGFQLSTSAAAEERYDVALRYVRETSWARIAAAVSYWTDMSSNGFDGYSGSGTLLLEG